MRIRVEPSRIMYGNREGDFDWYAHFVYTDEQMLIGGAYGDTKSLAISKLRQKYLDWKSEEAENAKLRRQAEEIEVDW